MKKFKIEITINERRRSTTTTSTHTEHEIMNDIIKKAIIECNAKPQKYIIILHGGKDNGMAKLSAYNERMLKQPINIVLEECFLDCDVWGTHGSPCQYVKNMDCVKDDTVLYSSCGICNFNPKKP